MEDLKAYRQQFDAISVDGERILREAAKNGFSVHGTDPLLLVDEMERQWMLLQVGPKTLRRALALTLMVKHLLSESIQTDVAAAEAPPAVAVGEPCSECGQRNGDHDQICSRTDEKIVKGEVAHG